MKKFKKVQPKFYFQSFDPNSPVITGELTSAEFEKLLREHVPNIADHILDMATKTNGNVSIKDGILLYYSVAPE